MFKGNKTLEKLPAMKGLNQTLGGAAAFLGGLIAVWLAFIVIIVFYSTKIGAALSSAIEGSQFLLFLSRINPIAIFLGLQ